MALEEVVRKVHKIPNEVRFNGKMRELLTYAHDVLIHSSTEEDIKKTTRDHDK